MSNFILLVHVLKSSVIFTRLFFVLVARAWAVFVVLQVSPPPVPFWIVLAIVTWRQLRRGQNWLDLHAFLMFFPMFWSPWASRIQSPLQSVVLRIITQPRRQTKYLVIFVSRRTTFVVIKAEARVLLRMLLSWIPPPHRPQRPLYAHRGRGRMMGSLVVPHLVPAHRNQLLQEKLPPDLLVILEASLSWRTLS